MPLTVGRSEVRRFAALLQRGVTLRVHVPCSVLEFLVEDLGLAPAYVHERITTVFLDGEVVDALDEARVTEGSLLALSGAMPGLLGAALRRGSPYARMRSEITRGAAQGRDGRAGLRHVRVKLFNLLLAEVGPALLARGILLEPRDVAALGLAGDGPPARDGELVEVRVGPE